MRRELRTIKRERKKGQREIERVKVVRGKESEREKKRETGKREKWEIKRKIVIGEEEKER